MLKVPSNNSVDCLITYTISSFSKVQCSSLPERFTTEHATVALTIWWHSVIVNSQMHYQKNRWLCLILLPSPNKTTFRVVLNQTFVSLTNFIGKNINFYDTK